MSDVNTRIVTCLYHHHYQSEIGGRNWPVWYYRWTLTNILSMGLPVTIFCSSAKESIEEIHKIIDYYKTNNVPDVDVEIIHHDLTSHPLYTDIITNRKLALDRINTDTVNNPNGFYWTRNEVICHTKLIFLKKTFDLHPETNNLVWIDAGITHWGLTPRSLGGREINGGSETFNDFYPHSKTTMFNPLIGNGFNKLTNKHELLLVGHKSNWYDSCLPYILGEYLYESGLYKIVDPISKDGVNRCSRDVLEWVKDSGVLNIRNITTSIQTDLPTSQVIEGMGYSLFSKQIVGGIICTNRKKLQHLSDFYYGYLTFLFEYSNRINHHILFTEEPILSAYHLVYIPSVLEFTDWSHCIESEPPNPCTTSGTYNKSFYKIWQDISNS